MPVVGSSTDGPPGPPAAAGRVPRAPAGPATSTGVPAPTPSPARPQLPPLALTGPVIVATVSALAFAAATRRFRLDWWRFLDLGIYRDAARFVLHGRPLYGTTRFGANSWTNTPFAAVAYLPVEAVHGEAIRVLAVLGNTALLVTAVALTLYGLGVGLDRRFVAWLVLLSAPSLWIEPVLTTIRLGQVNLALVVLVLLDLAVLCQQGGSGQQGGAGLTGGRSSRWCGIGIGLAVGIKLTPLLFVAYLLLRRRYRAAAVATATALVTVAIGFAAAPASSVSYWLRGTVVDLGRVGDLRGVGAQSLHSSVARALGDGSATTPVWIAADVATVVVGLALAVGVARLGHEMLAVATVGLLSSLVSPFAWSHHWVWFVPLLVVGAIGAARRASLTAWLPVAGLWLLLVGWFTGYVHPITTAYGPHLGLIFQVGDRTLRPLTGNLYPLLAYGVLGLLLVLVVRARRHPAR